jgi:hypothetical protein
LLPVKHILFVLNLASQPHEILQLQQQESFLNYPKQPKHQHEFGLQPKPH